ncbi:light-harvesting complex-like protein OHP2, chloroplastic [Actinidia eriantha]|uniref:light-harvesting complex-like protein OHP2, chloroplastic n=1 Tax=Actinidia eriantha TaxID=165200 RepID=UPI0025840634|nr:light-harvesting complex-like protein OHP2, chloroplastic [Actinidia eriantha]
MSVASSSIPHIKIPNSSSSLSSASYTFRFSATRPTIFTIRNSQTDGPLRRPVAPSAPTIRSPTPSSPPKPAAPVVPVEDKSVITMEFQRQKAKELQEYFKQKKIEEANQGPFFGFIGKNEISNGRWAMFGFAVGMLTEYATGSDFVDQVKILLSNFGIIDLE